MGVRRGTATPSKIYRGTVPVKKVMRGTVEVWSASDYPLLEHWGPVTTIMSFEPVHLSHTFTESGVFTVTATASSNALQWRVWLIGPWGSEVSSYGSQSEKQVEVPRMYCAAGDVVSVATNHGSPFAVGGAPGTTTGTLSIVKV